MEKDINVTDNVIKSMKRTCVFKDNVIIWVTFNIKYYDEYLFKKRFIFRSLQIFI